MSPGSKPGKEQKYVWGGDTDLIGEVEWKYYIIAVRKSHRPVYKSRRVVDQSYGLAKLVIFPPANPPKHYLESHFGTSQHGGKPRRLL